MAALLARKAFRAAALMQYVRLELELRRPQGPGRSPDKQPRACSSARNRSSSNQMFLAAAKFTSVVSVVGVCSGSSWPRDSVTEAFLRRNLTTSALSSWALQPWSDALRPHRPVPGSSSRLHAKTQPEHSRPARPCGCKSGSVPTWTPKPPKGHL